ncbi:MAG: hypothetical protein V7459_01495 [Oceanicoccus sp.]
MSTSSTGLPDNVANFLAYLFGWISGLVIFLLEKKNSSIKFHGAQSIVLFGSLTALNILLPIVPALGPLLMILIAPISMILWLVLLVMSLMGNAPRLPIIANFADQLIGKKDDDGPDSFIEKQ